ncbi:MAG: hypothetical protein NZ827_03270 [Aquificaceae bacterium]|nr:hypothetical protein [Aquificaceae bacterium]
MSLKRIIRIKEGIKDVRARELKEVEMQIGRLRRELERIEVLQEEVNQNIKTSFSEGLLIQYRSLHSQKRELLERIAKLEAVKEERRKRLKEAYRDLKALELLRDMRRREERSRSANIEAQRAGFLHLIKRWRKNA